MATRTTDTSSSEEEIYYTYYSSTECESDFEYEGKAGYINTCEPEYSKEELGKLGNYRKLPIISDPDSKRPPKVSAFVEGC